jgi:hypothetical protein
MNAAKKSGREASARAHSVQGGLGAHKLPFRDPWACIRARRAGERAHSCVSKQRAGDTPAFSRGASLERAHGVRHAQKAVVGINTVVDNRAAAAAASRAEWGDAPGPAAATLHRSALELAIGGGAVGDGRGGSAAAGEDDGGQRPATAGVYLRLGWTVSLGALDAALVLLLLVWPGADPLCQAGPGPAHAGDAGAVWVAVLAGVFLHVANLVHPIETHRLPVSPPSPVSPPVHITLLLSQLP